MSPDHRLLAWSLDTEGDEDHVLRIRDIDTGEDHPEAIPDTSYGVAWASDNRTVFYTTLDESRRPWRVWRHRLGTDPAEDVIVHQEDDDRFFCEVERTRSGGFHRHRPALGGDVGDPASCGPTTPRAPSPCSNPAARASSTASTTTATASSS